MEMNITGTAWTLNYVHLYSVACDGFAFIKSNDERPTLRIYFKTIFESRVFKKTFVRTPYHLQTNVNNRAENILYIVVITLYYSKLVLLSYLFYHSA